jgi:REP element-mobilizing transposase RayT
MAEHREFYRRHLPHWQPDEATLFVTFRLADSLPRAVIAALQERYEQEERALLDIADEQERQEQAYLNVRRAFGRWDAALDAAQSGPHWLADPQIAPVVVEALHHRDEQVYDLVAFCVMPNHVHLVCTPLQREDGTYHVLYRMLQSLKRHTARQSNKILRRQGTFWQGESYDHVVRDEAELMRIIWYVINNPVKAGLVSDWESWPWTYVSQRVIPDSW